MLELTPHSDQQPPLTEAIERTPSLQPVETEKTPVVSLLDRRIEELKKELKKNFPVVSPLERIIAELQRKCGPVSLWTTSIPGGNQPGLNLQGASKTLSWESMDDMLGRFAPKKTAW